MKQPGHTMKFKVYHPEGIENFNDFDDALIFVTVACSEKIEGKTPDIQITKLDNGEEIAIFKSAKIIVGENIYINEYKQKTIKCISCEGTGKTVGKHKTMSNTLMGSCSLCAGKGYRIVDEEKRLTTSGPFKVGKILEEGKFVMLENHPGETVFSTNCCHFDKRTAQLFANEANKIKRAETKAIVFGHRIGKNK